jgi:hypothetical protein
MAQSVHIGSSPRPFPQVSHSKMTQPHGMGVPYFSRDAEAAVLQSPVFGLCHDDQKTVPGDREPILAVL